MGTVLTTTQQAYQNALIARQAFLQSLGEHPSLHGLDHDDHLQYPLGFISHDEPTEHRPLTLWVDLSDNSLGAYTGGGGDGSKHRAEQPHECFHVGKTAPPSKTCHVWLDVS